MELREEFWKARKMLGCCREDSREEKDRIVVAACVNLEQPQHLRAKGRTNYQRTWGVTGIPEATSLPGALQKVVLNSYWIPLKTWLNLFLFLPRSTIPYLQPFGPDVLQN